MNYVEINLLRLYVAAGVLLFVILLWVIIMEKKRK